MKFVPSTTSGLAVVLCLLVSAAWMPAAATDTLLVSLRADELARARASLRRGDSTLRPALDRLLIEAERALAAGPFSVVEKKRVPPSGDRHDYMSLGPYWWPDSTKPNGLPYVRHDGRRNPETLDDYDAPRLKQMTDAVTTLALAYYFDGGERYASQAARLLRVWFVAPDTRMNPRLTYAQAIPGIMPGRGIGIIETRGLIRLLDAIKLIESSAAWTADDRRVLHMWMSQYLDWLLTSSNGRDEQAAKNNHGSWYDAQTAALALFLGRPALARRIAETSKSSRIALQIRPDGRQPLEESRTRSLDYSIFNLEALMQLAELGRKVGVDLWRYQARTGSSIRRALDYLATFADTTKRWSGEQITPIDPTRMLEVLRLGELVFNDTTYGALIARMPRERVLSHRVQLLYPPPSTRPELTRRELAEIERPRVVSQAERNLNEAPRTITAFPAARSAGGMHDFYSEGDYWWPDPKNPDGPYIRRDGETNPDNFVAHRDAMRRLSQIVPALVAAYELTNDSRYARHAVDHLRAWFVDESTRMNPNLRYAQAIKGHVTGRGIGIIDTIHLAEVAQAVLVLERLGYLNGQSLHGIKSWFRQYLDWLTKDEYGLDEKNNGNNHSVSWALQVAAFARLLGDEQQQAAMRAFFKDTLVPQQMAANGSFPRELARTKPYGYSLFELDLMAMMAQVLSSPNENLWTYTTPDGRGMRRAMEYMYPYIADKGQWPKPADVMYFDQWPVRQPSLLFGGLAFHEHRYIDLWKKLDADPTVDEVIRNYPIRQPLLWVP